MQIPFESYGVPGVTLISERWFTQMIVNVSKYHVFSNQFPTRKLKESKK